MNRDRQDGRDGNVVLPLVGVLGCGLSANYTNLTNLLIRSLSRDCFIEAPSVPARDPAGASRVAAGKEPSMDTEDTGRSVVRRQPQARSLEVCCADLWKPVFLKLLGKWLVC